MKSLNETDHEANRTAWKCEDVLKLANHFHHFDSDTSQHIRVHHFELSNDKDLPRFTEIGRIETMKICMAIDTSKESSEFTFYPFIQIKKVGSGLPIYFHLHPKPCPKEDDGDLSEFVPGIFKDMILDNWNKLDMAYIDDLFIAQARDKDNNPMDQMVRVHEYIINEDMIAFINAINVLNGDVPNITGVKLYPGVDLNKFGNKALISFTPVLGFTHTHDGPQTMSRMGQIEIAEKETFMEYMFPCPPTCVRKPKGGE